MEATKEELDRAATGTRGETKRILCDVDRERVFRAVCDQLVGTMAREVEVFTVESFVMRLTPGVTGVRFVGAFKKRAEKIHEDQQQECLRGEGMEGKGKEKKGR